MWNSGLGFVIWRLDTRTTRRTRRKFFRDWLIGWWCQRLRWKYSRVAKWIFLEHGTATRSALRLRLYILYSSNSSRRLVRYIRAMKRSQNFDANFDANSVRNTFRNPAVWRNINGHTSTLCAKSVPNGWVHPTLWNIISSLTLEKNPSNANSVSNGFPGRPLKFITSAPTPLASQRTSAKPVTDHFRHLATWPPTSVHTPLASQRLRANSVTNGLHSSKIARVMCVHTLERNHIRVQHIKRFDQTSTQTTHSIGFLSFWYFCWTHLIHLYENITKKT